MYLVCGLVVVIFTEFTSDTEIQSRNYRYKLHLCLAYTCTVHYVYYALLQIRSVREYLCTLLWMNGLDARVQ